MWYKLRAMLMQGRADRHKFGWRLVDQLQQLTHRKRLEQHSIEQVAVTMM